jgi:hypothetical protein
LTLTQQPSSQSFAQRPPQHSNIFPQNFGVYRASESMADMVIAHSSEESKYSPIFYVSTYRGFRSKLEVILHSESRKASPPMATAAFRHWSSKIDIWINRPNGQDLITTLKNQGVFIHTATCFMLPLPDGSTEVFNWKRSSGPEVASLNGQEYGMKLVRKSTGQVVAAWTGPKRGWKKLGKMAWKGEQDPRGELGTGFELAAIITRLALLVREEGQE